MHEHRAASLMGTCEANGGKHDLSGRMGQIQEAFNVPLSKDV